MIRIGCNPIEEAVTWALLQGFKMAWENGVIKLIVKVDSLTVYRRVKGMEEALTSHANMIQECQEWLARGWIITFKHIYREGNQLTNKLAKLALKSNSSNTCRWPHPLNELESLIVQDVLGTRMPRRV